MITTFTDEANDFVCLSPLDKAMLQLETIRHRIRYHIEDSELLIFMSSTENSRNIDERAKYAQLVLEHLQLVKKLIVYRNTLLKEIAEMRNGIML